MKNGRRSATRVAGLLVSVAAIVGGLGLASTSAQAAWVSVAENGIFGHLSLRSDPYPANFMAMSPGSVEQWQIETSLVDPAASLTVQVQRDGQLVERPDGLQLRMQSCGSEWLDFPVSPHCPTAATVLGPTPANSTTLGNIGAIDSTTPVFPLGTLGHGTGKYLLVTMSIPDTAAARADESLMGLTANLGLVFTAGGDIVSPPEPPGLASTGADAAAIALLASGLAGLGLLLRSMRSRHSMRRVSS